MTIKEWLYKHVNITFLLMLVVYLVFIRYAYVSYQDQRWGWMAVFIISSFAMIAYIRDWWVERL